KVGGYQRRTVPGKPSPAGSARRLGEAVESRIPCVGFIVVDNAQKRQPDIWHGMESFMPIRLNLVPEFRPCIHACERLACSRGSRLRFGYSQSGTGKARIATSCLASGSFGLLAESRYHR